MTSFASREAMTTAEPPMTTFGGAYGSWLMVFALGFKLLAFSSAKRLVLIV